MSVLEHQISDVAGRIVTTRRHLDSLLERDNKADADWDEIDAVKAELDILELEVDRARRWLLSCGITV